MSNQVERATLAEVAQKYGVDKLHSHSYIPFYQELLDSLEVKRMLEVGVGYESLMRDFVPFYVHGASLKMWSEYLPDAEIFACDIHENTLVNEGRIHSCVCDQSSFMSLHKMIVELGGKYGATPWNLIIDDGSHELEHQVLTATILRHLLAPGGAYVIEDVREPELLAYTLGGAFYKFDKRSDDALVVIRK